VGEEVEELGIEPNKLLGKRPKIRWGPMGVARQLWVKGNEKMGGGSGDGRMGGNEKIKRMGSP
jgi:hypothetical protein